MDPLSKVNIILIKRGEGTFLVIQWLRICTSNARSMNLIPSQGTRTPHVLKSKIKKTKKVKIKQTKKLKKKNKEIKNKKRRQRHTEHQVLTEGEM